MTLLALALVFGCLLLSGVTLFGALIVSRRTRRAMDDRVALVGGDATAGASQMPADGLTPGSEKWGEKVRRVFSFGMAHRWGMHASGLILLLLAAAAAFIAWLAFHVGLHFSYWVTAPVALASFFLVPHMLVRREQIGPR